MLHLVSDIVPERSSRSRKCLWWTDTRCTESYWEVYIYCTNYFLHCDTFRPWLLYAICMPVSLGHTGLYSIMSKSSMCQSCTSWREDEGQIRLAVKTRLMNDEWCGKDEGGNRNVRAGCRSNLQQKYKFYTQAHIKCHCAYIHKQKQYAAAHLACAPELSDITTHLRIGGKLACQGYCQLVTHKFAHTHTNCSQEIGMGSLEEINYEVQCQVEGHEEGTITISQQRPVNSSHH